MFPPEAFGVGVTVAELRPPVPGGDLVPAGVVSRPSRLGDLLPVALMTAEQKAAHLQRIGQAEAALAAFKAELVVGLAEDRPARDDRRRGQVGVTRTSRPPGTRPGIRELLNIPPERRPALGDGEPPPF